MEKFGKEYLNYWKHAVQKSIDGTIIAGPEVLNEYLNELEIEASARILDLGCSFGRMFEAISNHTSRVFGVDIALETINDAARLNYTALALGQAEKVPFPSDYFDGIVSWGVFDVVDQTQSLKEASRILKRGGWLLFTGKNSNYHSDDQLGFVAERNAKLKGFPNHFTRLESLQSNLNEFGFSLSKFYLFERRGDLGLNKRCEDKDSIARFQGYEYLLVLRKESVGNPAFNENMTTEFSDTAVKMAATAGFDGDIISYFNKHKDTESSKVESSGAAQK